MRDSPLLLRRAFTITDLLALVAGAAIGASALAVVGAPPAAPLSLDEMKTKEQRNLRGILQCFEIWNASNGGGYPLPSALDTQDNTVKVTGRAKDTSAAIFSVLIFNGFLPTEMLISPAETNPNIKEKLDYSFTQPRTAIEPATALWDPSFGVNFAGNSRGSLSYAHLQPGGGRLERWKKPGSSNAPVISTRGPQIKDVTLNDDGEFVVAFAKPDSRTLSFWSVAKDDAEAVEATPDVTSPDGEAGDPPPARTDAAWTGYVGLADHSVSLREKWLTSGKKFNSFGRVYNTAEYSTRPDAIFFDEPEDPKTVNDFLGIFTHAGEKVADYKAIWD